MVVMSIYLNNGRFAGKLASFQQEGCFSMRILVLDDDFMRHETFIRLYKAHVVICAQRYNDFLRELREGEPFDLIHLDHDLGDPASGADSYEDGWGKEVAFSGKDAVDQLAILGYKKKVIVHTMNSVVGRRMTEDLKRAGIDAVCKDFSQYLFWRD
jgi:hypothetical protein